MKMIKITILYKGNISRYFYLNIEAIRKIDRSINSYYINIETFNNENYDGYCKNFSINNFDLFMNSDKNETLEIEIETENFEPWKYETGEK